MSQEEQEQEEPTPKFIRMGCTRRLKFDIYTTHELLAEFRGIGVQLTHVTRGTKKEPHQNVQ